MAGPGRPGRPKGLPRTGGRKPGVPNKATREIRAIAQQYAEKAIREAARLMTKAESEQARLQAIAIILDRAYGRPAQAMHHTGAVGAYDASKLKDCSEQELIAFEAVLARLASGSPDAGGGPSGA